MTTPSVSIPSDKGTLFPAYTIRPTTGDDYPALADLINATQPNFPATAEGLREGDLRRPDYCHIARWVAEREGQLIGLGQLVQHPDSYDPHTIHPNVRVRAEYEGQGLGRGLYAIIEAAARRLGMTLFRAAMGENNPRAVDFAQKQGYTEYGRRIESALSLATFDPTPFVEIVPTLAAQGIELRTYSQLAGDAALERMVYDLQMTTEVEVPVPFPFTPPPFEDYRANVLHHPKIPHDGIIVAVAGRALVGMTMHYHVNQQHINVDYTGVQREYRGKGIALALKVAGAIYAQNCGAATLFTTNDPDNPAILTVNQKLGFVPRPALLMMQKQLIVDRE